MQYFFGGTSLNFVRICTFIFFLSFKLGFLLILLQNSDKISLKRASWLLQVIYIYWRFEFLEWKSVNYRYILYWCLQLHLTQSKRSIVQYIFYCDLLSIRHRIDWSFPATATCTFSSEKVIPGLKRKFGLCWKFWFCLMEVLEVCNFQFFERILNFRRTLCSSLCTGIRITRWIFEELFWWKADYY